MQLLEESLGAPEMLPKTRCEHPVISITLHFALGLWNLFYLEILHFFTSQITFLVLVVRGSQTEEYNVLLKAEIYLGLC